VGRRKGKRDCNANAVVLAGTWKASKVKKYLYEIILAEFLPETVVVRCQDVRSIALSEV
jgi:hypothetical protein